MPSLLAPLLLVVGDEWQYIRKFMACKYLLIIYYIIDPLIEDWIFGSQVMETSSLAAT